MQEYKTIMILFKFDFDFDNDVFQQMILFKPILTKLGKKYYKTINSVNVEHNFPQTLV